jgi:hypothetical protein
MNTFVFYIVLILCHFPMFVLMIFYGNLRKQSLTREQWTPELSFSGTAVFVNASINPLLYCWLSELRTAIIKTTRKMLCRQTDQEEKRKQPIASKWSYNIPSICTSGVGEPSVFPKLSLPGKNNWKTNKMPVIRQGHKEGFLWRFAIQKSNSGRFSLSWVQKPTFFVRFVARSLYSWQFLIINVAKFATCLKFLRFLVVFAVKCKINK